MCLELVFGVVIVVFVLMLVGVVVVLVGVWFSYCLLLS